MNFSRVLTVLWHCELKAVLIALGFVISPLDPCLFVQPKKQMNNEDTGHIHGILGIHVDDGIGGGDQFFLKQLKTWKRDSLLAVNEQDPLLSLEFKPNKNTVEI